MSCTTDNSMATGEYTTQRPTTICIEDSKPPPSLPYEIIVEILSRLPVKSLLQFRSVCKSWRSLISSPQFAKIHLSISSKDDEFTRHDLIWTSFDLRGPFTVKTCSLHSILNEPSVNSIGPSHPAENRIRFFSFIGECNGLLCGAVDRRSVFLWNPSARTSKELPRALSFSSVHPDFYLIHGIGYDESIDDYRVVRILGRLSVAYGADVQVYSLRSNSWRRIQFQDIPPGAPLHDSSKFVNGALHWIYRASRDSSPRIIVSFDIVNETFGEIGLPNFGDGSLTLGILQGRLCVLCNYYSKFAADIWVMKEYGVVESWTMLVSMPHDIYPTRLSASTALCMWKNGEILLKMGSRLAVYDSKDNAFKHHQIHSLGRIIEALPYVESLVSLSVDRGQ